MDAFDKEGMAIFLRNVAKHDWGFYTLEDERMHIQTIDKPYHKGKLMIKFWLENRGTRTFEVMHRANQILPTAREIEEVRKVLEDKREDLESEWIFLMAEKGWIVPKLAGTEVTIICYPQSHNKFIRKLDLLEIFPGAYPDWYTNPPIVDLDPAHMALRIGNREDPDHRHHLQLNDIIFQD